MVYIHIMEEEQRGRIEYATDARGSCEATTEETKARGARRVSTTGGLGSVPAGRGGGGGELPVEGGGELRRRLLKPRLRLLYYLYDAVPYRTTTHIQPKCQVSKPQNYMNDDDWKM